VAQLGFIRRMHFRDKLTIREISRRTGVSRNTIAKYLKDGTLEPSYPERRRSSVLDPFAAELERWLEANQHLSRKRRRTRKQLFEAL